MKKIVLFVLILSFVGCQKSKPYKMTDAQKKIWEEAGIELMDDVVLKECIQRGITYDEYMEELDSILKDWPFPGANGKYIYVRSCNPVKPDTVVDGVEYIKW